jgi:3-hydroxy-9,10-secoandrosta-1,3,5(10)-triene-9,17-dione monooxygenase
MARNCPFVNSESGRSRGPQLIERERWVWQTSGHGQASNKPLEQRSTTTRGSLTDLTKRAEALQPLLRKNAAASDRNRRASEENIQAIAEAGLFRLMVPKRYGGHEGTLRSHLEVPAALAEACGGTAWVTALINVCAWITGLFPELAQDEVFGVNPDARVSGVFTPSNQSRRVDGGLVISGKWYFSSGWLHADWAMVGVIEHDANGALKKQYLALVNRRKSVNAATHAED